MKFFPIKEYIIYIIEKDQKCNQGKYLGYFKFLSIIYSNLTFKIKFYCDILIITKYLEFKNYNTKNKVK